MKTVTSFKSAIVFALAVAGVSLAAPVGATVVVDGVSYDYAGIVQNVTGTTITIGSKTFSLGVGNVRKGKSTEPLSTVQPGTYVGVRLSPTTRGLPLVTDLTVLPQ